MSGPINLAATALSKTTLSKKDAVFAPSRVNLPSCLGAYSACQIAQAIRQVMTSSEEKALVNFIRRLRFRIWDVADGGISEDRMDSCPHGDHYLISLVVEVFRAINGR